MPHDMWDLSPLTRDQTHIPSPCIVRWIPNHWTTREAQGARIAHLVVGAVGTPLEHGREYPIGLLNWEPRFSDI